MSKVDLKPVKNEPDPDVIRILQDCLDDAKQGRLLEFTLVGRYESGQVLNARAGKTDDVFNMFGKLMDMALGYRERNID